MSAPATQNRTWPVFEGGKSLQMAGFGLGVLGLAGTAARAFMPDGTRIALHSYVIAYAYWVGLALAAGLLLAIWHAAKAKWVVAIRRPVEIMAATMPIFLVLFVPIALGMKQLYPWAGGPDFAHLSGEEMHLIHHREHWLNPTTFLVRTALYFVIWIVVSLVLAGSSFKQDKTGDPKLTERMWTWGPASLPFLGLAIAFAAFDWLMSLATVWFSSMWGVYYFAGSFVALFALLILVLRSLSMDPSFKGAMRVTHWLSTGQFLLAFTAFWGYIAFDQYMLTFVANLPDATPFLIARQTGSWKFVGLLLMFGHFLVPFLLLLSRKLKTQPNRIRFLAMWILFIHYVDLYWCVMPQISPAWATPDWSNLTAFLGVGGFSVATAVTILRGKFAVPVKDPFLAESLDYNVITAGTGYLTDSAAHDIADEGELER
ncbi:MAG: hypothetical protein ABI321_00925 [Polyangia bacterium]